MQSLKWKRAVAALLAMVMSFGISVTTVSAQSFSDAADHYAASYISKWSDYGVLAGADGLFEPDRLVTADDLAQILRAFMGYKDERAILTDITPERAVTRGEVFVAFAQAFAIAPVTGESTFADNAAIPADQKPYIAALQATGALAGVPAAGGGFNIEPARTLTRAELTILFDKLAGDLLSKPGTYTEDYPGNLVINNANVILQGASVNGDLILSEGVDAGSITLDGVTVAGRLIIRGGGDDDPVRLINGTAADEVIISKADGALRVVVDGDSKVSAVCVKDGKGGVVLEGDAQSVVVGADADVTLTGKIGELVVEDASANVTLGDDAQVEKTTVTGEADEEEPADATVEASEESAASDSKINTTIKIYSFNDFHGTLDQSVSKSNPGADRFVGYVKEQVAQDPENSMVLVAGDNYQGSALSNLNQGKPVSEMLKGLGLKYSALGNHEYDYGTDIISDYAKDGGITFLGANIIETATGKTPAYCQPYAIEEINGVKVGIIGFITPSTSTLVKASHVAGLEFRDPAPIAVELAKELRDQGCDIVIALTHLGSNQAEEGAVVGEAAKLAEDIPAGTLDGIISGHTHQLVAGVSNGTPIVQGNYNGRGLAKLEFEIKDSALVSVTPSCVKLDGETMPINEATTAMVQSYNEELAPIFAEVVGTTAGRFETKDDLAYWAGQLVFDFIKRTTGDDYVVIQNDGGWRSGTFGDDSPKDNKVTMGYLYTLMPFDNEIVLIDKMNGADLLAILNNPEAYTSKPDVNGAEPKDGNWYLADGTLIEETGAYKVMCNDFMLTGGDKYEQFVPYSADAALYSFIGTPLRSALAEQLKFEAGAGTEATAEAATEATEEAAAEVAAQPPSEGDTKELTVFFVSDLHGAFTGTNYATQAPHWGLSRIAALLKEEQAKLDEAGKEYLTVDVGDTIQGAGTTGFINNPDFAYPLIEGFNYLGFDAVVLGNHEFNFGIDALYMAYNGVPGKSSGFNGAKLSGNTFIGNFTGDENVTGSDPMLEGFKAYEVFDMDGVKVAVIGMTNPGSDMWDAIKLQQAHVYTESAIGATKRAIEKIKAGNEADVIVLAAHMSLDDSFARPGSGANSVLADPYIAANVDVFLGGHGHSNQNRLINGVRYGENVNAGRTLGTATITATYEGGKWVVKDKAGDGVQMNITDMGRISEVTVAEDAAYLAHMTAADAEAKAYTSQQIGVLENGDMVNPSPLGSNMNPAYTEPTKLVEFIHDVQLYFAEAEISIACPFSMNVQHVEGPITRGSLIGIYNYDSNTVYRLKMKGWQVDRFIEYVAETQYGTPEPGDLSIRHSPEVFYRNDSLGGLKYTMDLTKEAGSRVVITQVKRLESGEWEAFNPDETYLVAANDYRTSSGILSPTAGVFTEEELAAEDAPVVDMTDCNLGLSIAPDILSLMVYYIQTVKGGVIDASDYEKNWQIVPWWDTTENGLRAQAEKLIAEEKITGESLPAHNKALTEADIKAAGGTSANNRGAVTEVAFVEDIAA